MTVVNHPQQRVKYKVGALDPSAEDVVFYAANPGVRVKWPQPWAGM